MGGLPVGCIEEGFTVGYEVLGLIFMEVWWALFKLLFGDLRDFCFICPYKMFTRFGFLR